MKRRTINSITVERSDKNEEYKAARKKASHVFGLNEMRKAIRRLDSEIAGLVKKEKAKRV